MLYLLWAIDSDGEDNHEDDVAIKAVLVIERLSDSQEPLCSDDCNPHHSHGDGDVLDWVGQVGNHCVVQMICACGKVTNDNIVKEEHEDQESINKG